MGGWMDTQSPAPPPPPPPPRVIDMLQYFKTILPSVESLWSSLQDEVYFMGGGAAGGLWRHQQWSSSWLPSWILPRIRNQVKTVRIGDFLRLRWKHINKHCVILATRFTFIVAEKLKNMYFQAKTAWPPPNYDVISRNYGNWPSLNLTQHARKGWTNSYCSRGKLRKALGSGIPPPLYVRGLNYARASSSNLLICI